MNRNEFLNMIKNSGPSDRQSVVEVNELISVFPYFQSAYLLFLKGLKNTSDVRFDNQLHSCAMHIADREVLYYLLKKEEIPVIEEPVSEESAPETNETSTETQQTVIDLAKNSQDFITEIEKDSSDDLIGNEKEDHPVLITYEENDSGTDTTILVIDEESGSVEEKVIYMDPGFSTSGENELLELETGEEEQPDKSYTGSEALIEEITEKRSVKELQSELIDRFIQSNPRIEPAREKPDILPEDIAKPFTETRSGFVTETLAKIYIRQGYYSRAIEIYEKLSLKFPEKSSYFASQIEKVKDLIKK